MPETRIDTPNSGTEHLELRSGRWLLENRGERSLYLDALERGYSHEAALVYAADPRYQRVVRLVSPTAYMAAANKPGLSWGYILHKLVEADPSLAGRLGRAAAKVVSGYDDDTLSFDEEVAAARERQEQYRDGTGRPWLDGEEPEDLTEDSEQGERDRFLLELAENRARREAREGKRPASLAGVKRSEGRKDRPSRRPEVRRAKRLERKNLGRQPGG